jgi:hypothetical protein
MEWSALVYTNVTVNTSTSISAYRKCQEEGVVGESIIYVYILYQLTPRPSPDRREQAESKKQEVTRRAK